MRLYKILLRIGLIGVLWLAIVVSAQDDTPTQPATAPGGTFDLPITRDVIYVVQPRENLDGIGAFFDVSVQCLRDRNNLTRTSIIRAGDELLVSADCPPYDGVSFVAVRREAARRITDGRYFVMPGDTLDTIGRRFDISAEALRDFNNIDNSRSLRSGDVLLIPDDAPPYGTIPARRVVAEVMGVGTPDAAAPAGTLRAQAARGEQYIVQPGDTLDVIAQSFDVSLVSLQVANGIGGMRRFVLLPGDVLIIPADAPPYGVFPALTTTAEQTATTAGGIGGIARSLRTQTADGERYVIQPGDTLDVIGQRFNVSVEALRLANDIRSARQVAPGLEIVIPADAPPYGVFPALDQPAGALVAPGTLYVIQPGDTVDGIGARFNRDTRCILEANQVRNPRAIRAGQTLGIPNDCPPYTGFDVVPASARDGS